MIHAAILGAPSINANELVKYLIDACPSSFGAKALNQQTPLHLAAELGRVDIVKILLDAGADQTSKNVDLDNLLHAALSQDPTAEQLRGLLDLLDRDLLAKMMKERNRLAKEGCTPLHSWLQRVAVADPGPDKITAIRAVLKELLAISPSASSQALNMLDGAGNTVLHSLITQDADPAIIRDVLDFCPSLMYRENAVGRTPAEVARERFIRDLVTTKPPRGFHDDVSVAALVDNKPESFLPGSGSAAFALYGPRLPFSGRPDMGSMRGGDQRCNS